MVTSGEQALTPSKIEKLLSVVDEVKCDALLRLAISGGIRREDIVKILVKDIDIERRSVTFYQHKKKNHHTIYIPLSTVKAIEKLINVNKRMNSPYLFPSNSPKKPISSRTAYNILQKYLKLSGLNSAPFHALRSTCAKLCQSKGWSPEQTAKHLDDTLKTIQRHYTTPSQEEREEVAREKAIL